MIDLLTSPELLASILAGLGALTASALLPWIASRHRKDASEAKQDAEKIAEAVSSSALEARAKALESIASKLPEGLTPEQFETAFTQQVRIGGDLVISQPSSEERELVEGLVDSYHNQALSQAKIQFWFSVSAATIGFIYILYAATLIDGATFLSYFKVLPGVIIDAIAALFFTQAEKTRERATELYDRLRHDKQMVRAETVVGSIEDLQIRSAVKAQIALHMAGLSPKEIDLKAFMTNQFELQQGPQGAPADS